MENENTEVYPSPLIMTLGEQVDAKIKAGLLSPSDVLAVTSFVRKLVFRLSGQVHDLSVLEAVVAWVDRILAEDRLWPSKYPAMTSAVRREVRAMHMVLKPVQIDVPMMLNGDVQGYLDEAERLPVGTLNSFKLRQFVYLQITSADKIRDRIHIAHSIIDRLRFTQQPLSLADAKRLVLAVQTHWAPALQDLAQYFFPRSGHLWENHVLVGTDVGET